MPAVRVPSVVTTALGSAVSPDRRLGRRLAREAALSAAVHQREQRAYERAVHYWERSVARARRSLPVDLALGGSLSGAFVALETSPAVLAVAAVFALRALRSGAVLLRPPAAPAPPAAVAAVAPPPPRSSAAWPAVRRLEQVKIDLAALLPLVAPAGRSAAQEAWDAAAHADGQLRWQAARLAAVEAHRAVHDDLVSLNAGVSAQQRLLTAMADLVAAGADPLATGRLQDAADALHGLAAGLRAVRP